MYNLSYIVCIMRIFIQEVAKVSQKRKTVFIDGREGTTGLRIFERLAGREDIAVLALEEACRKDPVARKEALAAADIAFLCLPDDAARESVALSEGTDTVLIDTSTAHRTAPGWAYGFPELSPAHKAAVAASSRIAVPGCYASGFISLMYPLVAAGILPSTADITCHAVTGYSGGGKKMIAQYEAADRDIALSSPRQYALTQSHKHLPEMQAISGLKAAPLFCPIVSNYYAGMTVTVPLFSHQLTAGFTPSDIKDAYRKTYESGLVSYDESMLDGGYVAANPMAGRDTMKVAVAGSEERILLIAQFDNLGKGASGAAVQCLNLALGLPMETGLVR